MPLLKNKSENFISVKYIEKMLDTTIKVIFKTLKELLTGICQDVR